MLKEGDIIRMLGSYFLDSCTLVEIHLGFPYALQLLYSKSFRTKPVPEYTDEEVSDLQLFGKCCQAEEAEVKRMCWCCCGATKQDEHNNDDKLQRVLDCPELTLLSVAMTLGTAAVFAMPGLALKAAGPGAVRCRVGQVLGKTFLGNFWVHLGIPIYIIYICFNIWDLCV